jgi:hypothetical protein
LVASVSYPNSGLTGCITRPPATHPLFGEIFQPRKQTSTEKSSSKFSGMKTPGLILDGPLRGAPASPLGNVEKSGDQENAVGPRVIRAGQAGAAWGANARELTRQAPDWS